MTNYEKYRSKIDTMCKYSTSFGLVNGEICSCYDIECADCEFKGDNCRISLIEWLLAEYKEPPIDWSKVPMDTPILVRRYENERWWERHFAKYEDGKVYAWLDGRTSWSAISTARCTPWEYAKLAEREE